MLSTLLHVLAAELLTYHNRLDLAAASAASASGDDGPAPLAPAAGAGRSELFLHVGAVGVRWKDVARTLLRRYVSSGHAARANLTLSFLGPRLDLHWFERQVAAIVPAHVHVTWAVRLPNVLHHEFPALEALWHGLSFFLSFFFLSAVQSMQKQRCHDLIFFFLLLQVCVPGARPGVCVVPAFQGFAHFTEPRGQRHHGRATQHVDA